MRIFTLLFATLLLQSTLQAQQPEKFDLLIDSFYNNGNYKQELQYLKKAIQTVEKNTLAEIDYQHQLGRCLINLGNYSEAKSALLRAQKLIELQNEPIPPITKVEHHLFQGNLNHKMGNFPEALAQYEQSITILKDDDSRNAKLILIILYNKKSTLLLELGNYDSIDPLLQKAKKLAAKLYGTKHGEYANVLNEMARLYQERSQLDKAEPLFLEALAIYKEALGEEHPNYATAVSNLASFYYVQGKLESAETMYREVMQIDLKTLGEKHPYYADDLNNLGALLKRMGRYQEAFLLYNECLHLREKIFGKEHPAYAQSLFNIGEIYRVMGRIEDAEKILTEAFNLRKEIYGEKHPATVTILTSLGILYINSNQLVKANLLYKKIIPLNKQILGTQHIDYANSLSELATIYLQQEKYDSSKIYFSKAIQIYETNISPTFYRTIECKLQLARIAQLQGDYTLAEQVATTELEKLESSLGTKNYSYIKALGMLASIYIEAKKWPLATQTLTQHFSLNKISTTEKVSTLTRPESIRNLVKNEYLYPLMAIEAFNSLVKLYEDQCPTNPSCCTLGHTAASACIHFAASSITLFVSDEDKLKSIAMSEPALHAALEFPSKIPSKQSIQLQKSNYRLSEYSKSILLSSTLKAQESKQLGDLPKEVAQEGELLKKKIEELKKQMLMTTNDSIRNKVLTNLNDNNIALNEWEESIRIDYSHYYKNRYQINPGSVDEIQNLLPPTASLLSYQFTGEKVYLFLITDDTFTQIDFSLQRQEFTNRVALFRKSLSDYQFIKTQKEEAGKLYQDQAYWFYATFISPILSKLKQTKHLIIVPDKELGHLPFEAFLTEEITDEGISYVELPYLLNQFTISYNYSATLWKENQAIEIQPAKEQLLGLAASYTSVQSDSSQTRALRAPHLRNLRDALNDLPAARQEVEGVATTISGQFFYDLDANERRFKELAGNYGVIHLAMHGLLNTEHPILSSLAFTEDGDSTEDNFLQAYEISQMDLNAQLVVLSACETGYGKFQQGEGVMSLARSFMYAGVPSLVVSLWQVNDQSTSIIMQLFYTNLANGMDKAEALRQAKLNYIEQVENPLAAHPAFWAPFVQLGDSRPLQLKQKSNIPVWGWLLAIGLLVLTGGGLWAWRARRAIT